MTSDRQFQLREQPISSQKTAVTEQFFAQTAQNNSNRENISYSFSTNDLDSATTIDRVEAKIWQGIKLEQEDKLAEATESYRQAVELNPQSAVANHILAIALKKQGNFAEADRYHRLALSLGQNNNLQQSSNSTQILNEQVNGDRANSLKIESSNSAIVLPQLTSIAPGKYVENNQLEVTKIYLQQAKLYYEDGKYGESINACKEAFKTCPELPEIYKIYGNCLQKLGREAEAMGYYAKAVAKDPYLAEVYANIGSLYAKKNDWQEAIEYYQKALAVDPKLAKVCLHLSRAWERIGEDEKALGCLLHGLKLQPDILTTRQLVELGQELLGEDKLQLAITCYEYAVKNQPQSKALYLQLIKILEQDGQWKKAAIYYQAVVKLQDNNSLETSEQKRFKINNLLKNKAKPQNPSTINFLPPSRENNTRPLASLPPGEDKSSLVPNSAQSESEISLAKYTEELKQQPNSATTRLNLGNLFARQQQWDQAIANYQQAIKLKPDLVAAYLRLGKVYGIVGKELEGAEFIHRAYSMQLDIATPEQHYKLGDFWLKHQRGKLAMSCYRRAIQLKPDFKPAYVKLKQLIELEKQTQADSQIRDRPQILPASQGQSIEEQNGSHSLIKTPQQDENLQKYQMYFDMAVAAEKEHKSELALQCYEQAIAQKPQVKNAYFGAGKILSQKREWQKLAELYRQAIQYNSQEYSFHHNAGNAHFELQQWQEAISYFQAAIALNSQFSWSHFKLGEAYMELQQWQPAADALHKSIELKSDFDWAHYKLGDVSYQLKDWDNAVRAYQNALKITPDLPQTQEKLTDALRQRSRADKARAESFYNSAIKVNPDDESLYFKALEVKPDNPDHYIKLAQIYESKGKVNVALSFYRIALQVNPQNAEAKAKLNALQA